MRTKNEIREKISKYTDRINGKVDKALDFERYLGIIDALLWVIGDENGRKI